MLGQRPLAEQDTRDLAARPVVRPLRVADVELVDRSRDPVRHFPARVRHRPVCPSLRRHVQAVERGVDDAPVGDDRVGIDRLEPLVEVEREHGEHPETGERGRSAHVPALHERVRLGRPAALVGQRVARQPSLEARVAQDGAVPRGRLGGRGRRVRIDGLLERKLLRHRRADDDARGALGQAGAHVLAVELHRADDLEGRRVPHIDLGQRGAGGDRHDARARQSRHGLDPAAAAGEHEQPIAAQQELVLPALREAQGVGQLRAPGTDVDGSQHGAVDGEDARPVRLHEVRLVDPLFLDVRTREVDAGDTAVLRALSRGRGSHDTGHPGTAQRDRLAAEPVRPDERQRLPSQVTEQLAARAEGLQPVSLRLCSRTGTGAGGERQGCHEDDDGEEGVSLHRLTRYTPRV